MDRFEGMQRLSQDLGTYIHISFVDPNHIYSEEEYQELNEQFSQIFTDIKKKKERKNEQEEQRRLTENRLHAGKLMGKAIAKYGFEAVENLQNIVDNQPNSDDDDPA